MSLSSGAIMIFPVCPHCFKHDVAFYFKSYSSRGNDRGVYFFACGNCKRGVCAEMHYAHYTSPESYPLFFSEIDCMYPEVGVNKAPLYTPNDVASDYLEALSSLQHSNIKAACMMARSSIETAIVDKGGSGNNLSQDIKKLAANHVITQAMADWADEVRVIGNDAAHSATRDTPPTKEDAKDAISFAEMLFTYLYTLPNQIAERRIRKTEETG